MHVQLDWLVKDIYNFIILLEKFGTSFLMVQISSVHCLSEQEEDILNNHSHFCVSFKEKLCSGENPENVSH